MTRALIVLLLVNLVLGAAAWSRAMDNLALLHKGARAQAWVLWDSGAVDFARRDTRYGFAYPIPATRDEFADFVLYGSVEGQTSVINAVVVWLGVNSAGLLGLAVWSGVRKARAGETGSPP